MNTARNMLILCFGCLFIWNALSVQAQTVSEADAPDIALVDMGRALYRGQTNLSQPARLGEVILPATSKASACSGCHGERGEGRREAGISVPSVQWQKLRQPTASQAAYSDSRQIVRALTQGIGRDGRFLQAPMPQFTFTEAEQEALLSYLKILGTEAEIQSGVDAKRIVVGSALPLSGSNAMIGEHIRSVLEARFDSINRNGGVFGRRIEFLIVDATSDAASASLITRNLLQSSKIFALIGSLLPDPDALLHEALHKHNVPMVATLGVPLVNTHDQLISYLLPSLEQQIRFIINELERQCSADSIPLTTLVLHNSDAGLSKVVAKLTDLNLHVQLITDEHQLEPILREITSKRIVALLSAPLVTQVREQLSQSHSESCLGTLATISGQPTQKYGMVTDIVALPMPPIPLIGASDSHETLWPLFAEMAANIFIETLSRSGRQLSIGHFMEALDTLHQYQVVPGLAVTFKPKQRHGFNVTLTPGGDNYVFTKNTP